MFCVLEKKIFGKGADLWSCDQSYGFPEQLCFVVSLFFILRTLWRGYRQSQRHGFQSQVYLKIRYCFFYTLWPHLGRPRGVNTERGLWCRAVCGHSRLWSDLHHMPRGPQMSSKSCVPPHFLQEMHLAVAKKVLNVSYQYPWTKVLPGFFIWSETHS